MSEYSEHRNPIILFADGGVQVCYDRFKERVSYYEHQMEKNLSSPEIYRWYNKVAEEYDFVLKMIRKNCTHK